MADLAAIIAGSGAALSALTSAIVSVSKSGKVADEQSALAAVFSKFRAEFDAHRGEMVRNAEAIREELDKLTKRLDRRATGAMPTTDTYASIQAMQRQLDDVDRRSKSNEEKIDDVIDDLEKHKNEYRSWQMELVRTIAAIQTILSERDPRRTSHGP